MYKEGGGRAGKKKEGEEAKAAQIVKNYSFFFLPSFLSFPGEINRGKEEDKGIHSCGGQDSPLPPPCFFFCFSLSFSLSLFLSVKYLGCRVIT